MRIVITLFLAIILLSSTFVTQVDHNGIINEVFAQPTESEIHDIGNYSVYGLQNVILAMNVTVNSGNVGVHNASSNMQLPSNAEIWIKDGSTFVDPNSAVVGDTIIIRQGSTIQNVFFNELQNDGTVLGMQTTPLILPVVGNLPDFPNSVPGTTSIAVPKDSFLTLAPGQYGNIFVDIGATLTLTGGIYNVTSIDAKKDSRIFFDDSSKVVVQNQINWEKGVTVGPSLASTITAKDIVIFVKGSTEINAAISSTDFGKDATVQANIFAPNGEIKMNKGTHATGAFIGKTVTIEQDSVVNLDSGFNRPQRLADEYLSLITKLDNIGTNLNQTTITQELVDEINSDLTRIKEIVIELQNLGFDGEATTIRIGTQMVGTVKFFDSQTSELLFAVQIPDGTLAIFFAVGLENEFQNSEFLLSFDDLANLLSDSLSVVDFITNLSNDDISGNFVLSGIGAFHPSTGETFIIGQGIRIAISVAISECIISGLCPQGLAQIVKIATENILIFLLPSVTIQGIKFNDIDGDGIRLNATTEEGLQNWEFTISDGPFVTLFPTDQTDENGQFNFDIILPRSNTTVTITEALQDGWQSTTGDISQEVFINFTLTDVNVQEPILFGNQVIPPVFFENFDDGIVSDWTQSQCFLRNSGQACEIGTSTFPQPVPSEPLWGFVQVRDFVSGCAGSVATKFANTFTVDVEDNYDVSAFMFASTCDICDEFARLFVDGDLVLQKKNQNLHRDPPQLPTLEAATIHLLPGQHTIEMGHDSSIACSGSFRGSFDNIKIEQSTGQVTTVAALVGGPYFDLILNQTSVNTTRPDSITIPLQVNWLDGFVAEPVSVTLIGNATANTISHSVTSVHNATTYQLFDITFDVLTDAQPGEYQFFILVDEVDDQNSVGDTVTLFVE
jgi:hypothetical protein